MLFYLVNIIVQCRYHTFLQNITVIMAEEIEINYDKNYESD